MSSQKLYENETINAFQYESNQTFNTDLGIRDVQDIVKHVSSKHHTELRTRKSVDRTITKKRRQKGLKKELKPLIWF